MCLTKEVEPPDLSYALVFKRLTTVGPGWCGRWWGQRWGSELAVFLPAAISSSSLSLLRIGISQNKKPCIIRGGHLNVSFVHLHPPVSQCLVWFCTGLPGTEPWALSSSWAALWVVQAHWNIEQPRSEMQIMPFQNQIVAGIAVSPPRVTVIPTIQQQRENGAV